MKNKFMLGSLPEKF